MDFSFTEVQEDLRALTKRILDERVTVGRLKELEAGTERIDRDVWSELAKANLLGIALPEDVGGSGYGVMELAVILQEVGAHVAPVPLLATVALAALPIARFGTDELKQRLLPAVIAGETFLTGALEEAGGGDPTTPAAAATPEPDGGGWILNGEKVAVPWGQLADHVVVSTNEGLFVVGANQTGVEVQPAVGTTTEPQAVVTLRDVRVAGEDTMVGPGIVKWAYEHAVAAACATAVGVFDGAIALTSKYITERHQFDRPIATFQGATLKAADAYIDLQAITVSTWSAIWRLAEDKEGAADSLAIAKFWVADGGQRIAYACQHLHGGIGVDTDYPLHRYFLWAKECEAMFGGATAQLLRVAV